MSVIRRDARGVVARRRRWARTTDVRMTCHTQKFTRAADARGTRRACAVRVRPSRRPAGNSIAPRSHSEKREHVCHSRGTLVSGAGRLSLFFRSAKFWAGRGRWECQWA